MALAARPLVGITSIRRRIPTTLPGKLSNATVHVRLVELVTEAGGLPMVVDLPSPPEEIVARVDGVLLNGGSDVDPDRYGEQPGEDTDYPDPGRDEFEFGLARAALERGIPIFGLCRGLQIVNVELGGSLIQDLAAAATVDHDVRERFRQPVHRVEVEEGTVLARALRTRNLGVNSVHHQAVDRLGEGLRSSGRAPDGVIEAVEDSSRGIFGVQWHPEFLGPGEEAGSPDLFREFVGWCSGRVLS